MTREDPLIRVRLPERLKEQLQAIAAESRRSMNAEIVSRLEASLSGMNEPSADARFEQLERRLTELEALITPEQADQKGGTGEASMALLRGMPKGR